MNIPETKMELYEHMSNVLFDISQPPQKTMEAARYVALNETGGLHRPLLLFATARGYSVPIRRALPFGAAIEFIHSASLIDDDIADKSDLRRGKPSCHRVFGEDVARLANTFLVQTAYGQIVEGNDYPMNKKLKIVARAYKVGQGMPLGQERDITQEGLELTSDVMRMYEKKSGLLIGLALATGGVIGGACEEDVETLNRIGICAGTGYQIADDALDVFATKEDTGKPIDQDNNKRTLIKLIGWESARRMKEETDSEVDRLLCSLHGDHSLLGDMIMHLRHRHDNYLNQQR